MKTINLKIIAFTAAIIMLFGSTASAQKGIVKFDYEYKSNAQGKMKTEQNRGRKARMYWNAAIKRWTVEVDYGGSAADDEIDFGVDTNDGETTSSVSNTRLIVYHYDYKSNAQGKIKTEQSRGKKARMFYDKNRRRWAVEVDENSNVGGNNNVDDNSTPTVRTTKSRINTAADVGSGTLPSGATISYFPDKQMAEEIHKAALKQGDWSKMWYDENRSAWAVAIKIR